MKEEILVNHGWKKRWITDKQGNEIEQFYWDKGEHYEFWYWLKYIGPKGKWRPPANWRETRKRLVSHGYEYWEPYPYPKASWVEITEEEIVKVKDLIGKMKYEKLSNLLNLKTKELSIDSTGVPSFAYRIPWIVSETYYFPETDMLIRKWRGDEEDI